MDSLPNIVLIPLVVLTLCYTLFLFWCLAGWKKLKTEKAAISNYKTTVSIIIPARNEEENIADCLHDLLHQSYPDELVEILVANDHSTDQTTQSVRDVIRNFPHRSIRLINMDQLAGKQFKKQVLSVAIQNSTGELIVTTDADCRMSENWLSAIAGYYEKEHPDMIAGPVCFYEEKNIFQKMQSLEFSGLVGIGAGAIAQHMPLMCNGGNLAYTKQIFQELNGFTGQEETISGDDTQIMFKIAKKNPASIHFLKSADAVVCTKAVESVQGFFHQRNRWASKIPFGMSAFASAVAATAFLLHVGLIILFVYSLLNLSLAPLFLMLVVFKSMPEFWLMHNINSFLRKKKNLWLFIPAQFFYPFYISIVGITSMFGSYDWKGRKVSHAIAGFNAS